MKLPTLKIEMNLGDIITLEVGTEGADFVHEKHSIRISLKEGSRMGKVDNIKLEAFCIECLTSLGYKIK